MTSSLASFVALLRCITNWLSSEFAMTNLGALYHFLGISVTCSSDGLFLPQQHYVIDLRRARMTKSHLTATPIDSQVKLSMTSAPVESPSGYRILASTL
jgi:hypothetical protein